jgi:hypothetical protein
MYIQFPHLLNQCGKIGSSFPKSLSVMTSPLDCSHQTYTLARALSLWQTSQENSFMTGMKGAYLKGLANPAQGGGLIVLLQAAEPWLNLDGEAGL